MRVYEAIQDVRRRINDPIRPQHQGVDPNHQPGVVCRWKDSDIRKALTDAQLFWIEAHPDDFEVESLYSLTGVTTDRVILPLPENFHQRRAVIGDDGTTSGVHFPCPESSQGAKRDDLPYAEFHENRDRAFELFNIPSDVATIKLKYIFFPPPLESDDQELSIRDPRAHNLICFEAAEELKNQNNPEAMAMIYNKRAKAYASNGGQVAPDRRIKTSGETSGFYSELRNLQGKL